MLRGMPLVALLWARVHFVLFQVFRQLGVHIPTGPAKLHQCEAPGVAKVSKAEIGPLEVSEGEVGPLKVGIAQIGLGQEGAICSGVAKVEIFKRRTL